MRRGSSNRGAREPGGRPAGRGPGVAGPKGRPRRRSMKISAKGEYALKAMLDLSMHESSGLVSIQEIAARQSIPQRYLEQVLLQLKRASLLTSKRGAAGGYHLTRPPGEITVGEVLRAIEGEVGPFEAARRPRRGGADHGSDLTELWDDLSRAVSEVIDRKTTGDLATRPAERRAAARAARSPNVFRSITSETD